MGEFTRTLDRSVELVVSNYGSVLLMVSMLIFIWTLIRVLSGKR